MKRKPAFITIILIGSVVWASCNSDGRKLSEQQSSAVKDSVQVLTNNISRDLSATGPVAWLTYFENSPHFFMASDGSVAFPNYDTATSFVKNFFAKNIRRIDLKWGDMRIDPLTTKLATLGAFFHEDFTNVAGKHSTIDGYVTGTAEQTEQGWKLRNLHWSNAGKH